MEELDGVSGLGGGYWELAAFIMEARSIGACSLQPIEQNESAIKCGNPNHR